MFGRRSRRSSTQWTTRCGPLLYTDRICAQNDSDKIMVGQWADIINDNRKRLRKCIKCLINDITRLLGLPDVFLCC